MPKRPQQSTSQITQSDITNIEVLQEDPNSNIAAKSHSTTPKKHKLKSNDDESSPTKRKPKTFASTSDAFKAFDEPTLNIAALLQQSEKPTFSQKGNNRYRVSFAKRAFVVLTGSLYTQDFDVIKEVYLSNRIC
jgi:hypothetical protein